VQSQGNDSSHVVLRGSLSSPNYTPSWVQQTVQLSHHHGLKHRLLIDCSHDNNPSKDPTRQEDVFQSVLKQFIFEGNDQIMGLMIESHLCGGKQSFSSPIHPAISLTDPCLDWEDTKRLIFSLNEAISSFSTVRKILLNSMQMHKL
jgi:3-deoxy-7-phosphoheptulonate synthase